MGKIVPLTEEEVRILEEGYRNKESLDEISKKIVNRSKDACRCKKIRQYYFK